MRTASKPLVFLGAGGHAKVLLSMAKLLGLNISGICCPELTRSQQATWQGIPVLGDDDALELLDPNKVMLVNAVGFMPKSRIRAELFSQAKAKGFCFATLVHPMAFVDDDARLSEGVQVMAGAVIQVNAYVADNTIVNTNATVEHDCDIGSNNHIAPGATLCGQVTTGNNVFVGANATVIQQVSLGVGAIIAAGAVVVRSVPDNTQYGRLVN